jgi:hypothetical protein
MKNLYVVINTSRNLTDKAEVDGFKPVRFTGTLIGIAEGVKEKKNLIDNFMESREDSEMNYIQVIKMEKK